MKSIPSTISHSLLKTGYEPRVGVNLKYFRQYLSIHSSFTTDERTYRGIITNQPVMTYESSRFGGIAKISQCNLSISNVDGWTDIFKLYPYPENTEVDLTIYFPDEDGNFTEENSFTFYTGVITDFPTGDDAAVTIILKTRDVIKYENLNFGNLFNKTDYPDLQEKFLNIVKNVIYGDHICEYGDTTVSDFTYDTKNNMPKLTPLANPKQGNRKYHLADHVLKEVDKLFYYDSSVERLMELSDFTILSNSVSDGTVVELGKVLESGSDGNYTTGSQDFFYSATADFLSNGVVVGDILKTTIGGVDRYYFISGSLGTNSFDITTIFEYDIYLPHHNQYDITYKIIQKDLFFYDIWKGEGRAYAANGWSNFQDVNNGDKISGTTIDTEFTSWSAHTLTAYFSQWDKSSIDDANINEVIPYAAGSSDQTTSADVTLTVNGVDAKGDDNTLFRPYGTQTATQAGINSSIDIVLTDTAASDPAVRAGFLEMFKRIKFKYDENPETFYGSCKGKTADSTLAGLFTGLSLNDMIENPIHIICDLIINSYFGFNESTSGINTTRFQTAATLRSSWKFAMILNTNSNFIGILRELAEDSISLLQIDESSKWSIVSYDEDTKFSSHETDEPVSTDVYEYDVKKNALSFDATDNNVVRMAVNSDLQITGDLTIIMTILFTTFTGGDSTKDIISIGSGAGATASEKNILYNLRHLNTDGKTFQALHQYGTQLNETINLTLDVALELNTYYTMVFRRKEDSQRYNLDFYTPAGVLVASAYNTFTNDAEGGADSLLHIGGSKSIPVTNKFQGKLKNISIFAEYITSTSLEKKLGRILLGDEASIKGYWRLDEGRGTSVFDVLDGADGTIDGVSWFSSTNLPQLDYYDQNPIIKRSMSFTKLNDNYATKIICNYYKDEMKSIYQESLTVSNLFYSPEVVEKTLNFNSIKDETTIGILSNLLSFLMAKKPLEITFYTFLNSLGIDSWDIINIRHYIVSGMLGSTIRNTKKYIIRNFTIDYSSLQIQIIATEHINTTAEGGQWDEDQWDNDQWD